MKIAITGARGLLGWHAAARLHAANCAARFRGKSQPYSLVPINRVTFQKQAKLAEALSGCDSVLHFAGVNRGSEEEVEHGNPAIAEQLTAACLLSGSTPHIVYANSVHSERGTPYGRSKRRAGEILKAFAGKRFTDMILPHIFGECARPYYNNVTATLIDQLIEGVEPTLDPAGEVNLLHAGAAAELAISAATSRGYGRLAPLGRPLKIAQLYQLLAQMHASYEANIFPNLGDPFLLALFNSYRTAAYPRRYPRILKLNSDQRGVLFEVSKGGNAAQSFLSTSHPGIRRGDHFHTTLVERFLVVKGEAVIRIRKVLTDEMHAFEVSGETPAAIDMPPLHTHHIENVGTGELITYFWAHRIFDPTHPDTFADPVLQG